MNYKYIILLKLTTNSKVHVWVMTPPWDYTELPSRIFFNYSRYCFNN